MLAHKDTNRILKQEKGVFLIESHVRPMRPGATEVMYTVTAHWTPKRFHTGDDLDAAEHAFEQALTRAPQRIR